MDLRWSNTIAVGMGAIAILWAEHNILERGVAVAQKADLLVNISLEGSPNETTVGEVSPDTASIQLSVDTKLIIGGFRARGCGDPAPDFAVLMHQQVGYGLRVPYGITLYDAGIGHYNSGRCGGRVEARAIGAVVQKPGTYELQFFGGKVTKTVTVE